jgi:hypothetical protein
MWSLQDLAVLVSDQGGMLDDIEANMVKVSTRVHDGTEQLRRADKTQRSSRNRVRAPLPCLSLIRRGVGSGLGFDSLVRETLTARLRPLCRCCACSSSF